MVTSWSQKTWAIKRGTLKIAWGPWIASPNETWEFSKSWKVDQTVTPNTADIIKEAAH